MKKRILSLLLALVMLVGMIPATSLTAFAAITSVTGIEVTGDGYYINPSTNNCHIKDIDALMISGTSKFEPDNSGTNTLYTNESCTTRLKTEPKLGETYYFNVSVRKADTTNNITNSNSNIKISGFYGGKVLSTETKNTGFFYCVCSIKYGELTGGVKAFASGVAYDSAEGGYAPNFTTLKAVSTEGKELEHTMVDGKYSYYGAKSGCFYKTNRGTSFSDMLTTEPQDGETYYSYFLLESIDGNLNIEEDLVDIRIPGYEVEYIDSYERDGGFTSLVVYKATKEVTKVGRINAVGTGYEYSSTLGAYTPVFSAIEAYDTDGNKINFSNFVDNSNYSFYTSDSFTSANKLTTAPQDGETYYFGFDVNLYMGNVSYDMDFVKAIINNSTVSLPGFEVEFSAVDSMEGEKGRYAQIIYKATKEFSVYVGGVRMSYGDYLAVGATTTQTTKPSGGYAYYKDGKLTLNNYSYEGKGYKYDSYIGAYATVYAERKLTVELVGTNTLKQTNYYHDAIFVGDDFEGYLTIQGDGSLNATAAFGISARSTITVNGGTIVCTCTYDGMCTYNQDIIINGGNVTASGSTQYGIRAMKGSVVINGGNVTATGGMEAISYGAPGSFTIPEGMKILASTTEDGELGEYVAANHDSYKKIVVRPAPEVYVGGVGMCDGDYLAVGATKTQTTKPSGGYAYYKDDVLTLNNYSYEGGGYLNSSGFYAVIYTKNDLTFELIGNNTLTQTKFDSDMIYVDGANLTVGGDGKLTGTSRGYALRADKDITINGGTVEVSAYHTSILSYGDVIINGGDIVAESVDRIGINANDITINGGDVTAIGGYKAIHYDLSDSFSVAEGMKIQASTTVDGELGEYVAENHDSYKKIVIKPDAGVDPPVDPPEDIVNPFIDVTEADWFYESAMYVYSRGLMTGLTPTVFGPAINLCRAQFAVILWRMNGSPVVEYKATFPDVPAGTWYTDAVLWANQNGIITGYSHNGHFGSADNITREQMALMMYRYANEKSYDTSKKADFGSFRDAAGVSAFAKDGMQWAIGNSIITGKENGTALDPQGNASRAECATIIMRFSKTYEK